MRQTSQGQGVLTFCLGLPRAQYSAYCLLGEGGKSPCGMEECIQGRIN